MSTSHKFRESETIKTNKAAIQGQTSRKYGLERGERLTKELEDAPGELPAKWAESQA